MARRAAAVQAARRLAVAGLSASRIAVPLSWLARPARAGDPADVVRWCRIGRVDDATRLAVVAHWDPRGEVGPADRALLSAVAGCGFSVLVVSTADAAPEALAEGLPGVAAVATRANVGFDFLSWRRGLEWLRADGDLERVERLLLLNTSMYGPVRPIGPFLDLAFDAGDVVGFTASREFMPHAQSYALALSGAAVRSPGFLPYWQRVRPSTGKWGTIAAHELRWQRDLISGGLRAGVVVPAPSGAVNPLTHGWAQLLDRGFPLVKKSLFTVNYDGVDLGGWADRIGDPVACGLIQADLRRLGVPVPPPHRP